MALAVLATVAAIAVATVTGIKAVSAEGPSEAAALALRLDAVLDQMPEPHIAATDTTTILWTLEILPFFEYEGVRHQAVAPARITLTPYIEGDLHNHVLGQAGCSPAGGGPIWINARVANPVSSWYGNPTFLMTLTHELGHIQGGGLCFGSSEELESTTQLVALEVMAAMANQGNRLALYSLLSELRGMAMSAVYYEALRDGNPERYYELNRKVYPGALQQSRQEKSRRRWATDMDVLKEILFKYNAIPMAKVLKGLDAGRIPNLALPPDNFYATIDLYTGQGITRRALVIDDLKYVIEHAEEMAADDTTGVRS